MTQSSARHRAFDQARRRAELSIQQLWLRYLALGGLGDRVDLEAFLLGLTTLEPADQDVLAHALNEALTELYEASRVPYLLLPHARDTSEGEDPLAVLNQLLTESTEADKRDTPAD